MQGAPTFEAECVTIPDLYQEHQLSGKVFIKMDIEGVEIEVMERALTGRSRESRNKKLIPCRYHDVGGHTGATARRYGARDHGGILRINRRRRWERLDSLGGVLGQAAAVLCGSLH